MKPSSLVLFIRLAANRVTLIGGVKIAAIVGTILNLINQGHTLLGGAWGQVHVPKFCSLFACHFVCRSILQPQQGSGLILEHTLI